LSVPGPNNAALNPVLTGAKKATLAGVDYISTGKSPKARSWLFITRRRKFQQMFANSSDCSVLN
jgi:hypothetical protein